MSSPTRRLCNPKDKHVELSCTWYKAERQHIKLSHGVRKFNNTEKVSKWKSELEIANSSRLRLFGFSQW